MSTSSSASPGAPKARSRRAKRMNGDDREAAILETCEVLLETHSLHELSVDVIARGAGISRSSFYFYFPSKEAVLLSLMDRVIGEANARRDAAFAAVGPDPRELCRVGITAFYDTFREHRAVSLAAADSRDRLPEARELWSRVMDGWVELTAGLIALQPRTGAAAAVSPRDLATALNLMNERVLHATFAQDTPSIDEASVVDTLVAIWTAAIFGPAPDPGTTPERT
ncbi:MAG: TetR/AcrR family transcriptional regulator [Solirubrobacteraceae bacterium]|nr:TetR/AcrR family transcriptional regulator [Solirubrobacteraceae bacterium]